MPDLIGKALGPYRIVEQIGLGGMATVFKAYQPSMDRYVALKVLSTHLAQDATFVKRFRQEAKVIAKLEHMCILPVYDHGEEDGYLYLVMRFIEAGTLKDRLEGVPLSLVETRHIVTQVGLALEYAHELGVVHRDLKPSNVLVDPQGGCYLTDFGIAKMVESTLGLTGSGVLGTPHYMAPEQSQALKVDHRADIYAMGVILYELVTGRVPFDAETPFAVALKHITEPLPLPRSIRPDLPEAVERVILKALAKNPTDRYQSMRDLVAAFDQAVQTAPVAPSVPPTPIARGESQGGVTAVVPPLPPTSAPWGWLRRQPPWLLAAAGMALVVLLVVGVILSRRPGRAEISGGPVPAALPTPTAVAVAEVTTATPTETAQATATTTATPQPTVTATQTATPSPTSTPTATGTSTLTRMPTPTRTPRPTPTPTPMPTPSSAEQARLFAEPILATIADRPPDYQDDFSNPGSGWYTGIDESGETGYKEGTYYVLSTNKGDSIGDWHGPAFSDFVLEVDVQFVSGEDGNWMVILRDWREPNPPPQGFYGIEGRLEENTVFLRKWDFIDQTALKLLPVSATTLMKSGYETSHLMAILKGNQMALYLNGQPVGLGSDDTWSSGTIGLAAISKTDTPLEVRFDNLKVWDISGVALP